MNKFIIFTIILNFFTFSLKTKSVIIKYPPVITIGNELTEENLTNYLNFKQVKFLKLTLAQAKHESGNFTSVLCINNHNLFGMRKPEVRNTTALGTKNKYAFYDNWKESVNDFILFQDFVMKKNKTKKAYIYFITHKYAADKNYYKKLKKYL